MGWLALVLGLLGLVLSGFFSGSETGFYRANRLRLLLDARAGQRVAQALWWLSNHPAVFVATTLVGNNVANYLVSLAVVLAVDVISGSKTVELVAPVVLAPVLFVLGELLPKQMFYQAPNRLLYRCGPWFLMFAVVLAPISAVLWVFGRVLEYLVGTSHPQWQLVLLRRELESVLDEGHEAGVLRPVQRQVAQGLLASATLPVAQFCVPSGRLPRVRPDYSRADLIRLARRHHLITIPVEDPQHRKLIGYVVVGEVALSPGKELTPIRPLPQIQAKEPHISALVQMHTSGHLLAQVVDEQGRTVGLLPAQRLYEALFRGGR